MTVIKHKIGHEYISENIAGVLFKLGNVQQSTLSKEQNDTLNAEIPSGQDSSILPPITARDLVHLARS